MPTGPPRLGACHTAIPVPDPAGTGEGLGSGVGVGVGVGVGLVIHDAGALYPFYGRKSSWFDICRGIALNFSELLPLDSQITVIGSFYVGWLRLVLFGLSGIQRRQRNGISQ